MREKKDSKVDVSPRDTGHSTPASPESAQTRTRVVLAAPDENRNIGSVCRAMKTMGVHDLVIVPKGRSYDSAEVSVTAVHAADVYENARLCASVAEAVSECALAVAFTRRSGRRRKLAVATPEEVAGRVARIKAPAQAALVFGNEEHGLTGDQIDSCHMVCRIPSAPEYPSLNLAQAVQIACYALFRTAAPLSEHGSSPVDARRVEALTEEATAIVERAGYAGDYDRKTSRLFIRDLIARSALTPGEARRLTSILKKIRYHYTRSST